MLCMATGELAHLGCKFLSDVSVVNSPIVVELLVITVLFCVVLPEGRQHDTEQQDRDYLQLHNNRTTLLLTNLITT